MIDAVELAPGQRVLDLAADPSTIRKVTTVFKDGVGYDSGKLIESAKGRVGID